MESASIDWLSYGIIFILGSAVGALLSYWLQPSSQKSRQLEKQLNETEHQHAEYQEQVSSHFEETAELFSELTKQYKKVYSHLAQGSQNLCNDDLIEDKLKLIDFTKKGPTSQLELEEETEENYQMPRDYADKNDQEEQGGTLSEDFGFQKKRDTPIDG